MTPERIFWGPRDGLFVLYRSGKPVAQWHPLDWPNMNIRLTLGVLKDRRGHIETPEGPVFLSPEQVIDFIAGFMALTNDYMKTR